jgi:hypothetical protein
MSFRIDNDALDSWLYTLLLFLITTFFFFDPSTYAPKIVVVGGSWYLMFFIGLRRRLQPHFMLSVLTVLLLLLQLSRFSDASKFSKLDSLYPWGVLYWVLLAFMLLDDSIVIKRALKQYIVIFVVLAIPSIFIQIALLFNAHLSYSLIHLGGRQNYYRNYYNLAIFFDHSVWEFGSFTVVRLQGLFEEPGMFGTDCALLLTANQILFPEYKWVARALVLMGLLSVSFAFYIYAIGLAVVYLSKHFLKAVLLLVPICTLLFFLAPSDIREAFSSLVLDRFVITDEGVFQGDTGYIDYAERYSAYLQSASATELTFGHGSKSNQLDQGAQYGTYQSVVYEGGFLGLALMVCFSGYFLVWTPLRAGNYSVALLTFICLLFMYHRADFLSAQYCALYAAICIGLEPRGSPALTTKVPQLLTS